MAKKPKMLLISEKKSLMDNTKAVYEKYKDQIPYDIDFITFAGHVVELFMPEDYDPEWKKWRLDALPLIPERFRYKPIRDKSSYYDEAVERLKNGHYDYLCNNCDPGREGQLIFHAFLTTVDVDIPVKRLWPLDTTEETVKEALMNMRDETEPSLKRMTDASFLRSYFDWLVGMNFSRAVSIPAKQTINLGRVMTPTLAIVVDRELEIRNFEPKDFWTLVADFGDYKGVYFDDEGTVHFYDYKEAKKTAERVGDRGTVNKVERKETKSYAPRLHSLADLQAECNERFGYTMQQTLNIAQSLYEKKLLSYPRTESSYITTALAKKFPSMLKPLLEIGDLKREVEDVLNQPDLIRRVARNKAYVDDNKVSDHYAIVPTGVVPDLNKLTPEEVNVYDTVARRFLAIFLPPEIVNRTTIITESNGLLFKTTGKVVVDPGYTRIYSRNSKDVILPDVKEGEVYDVKGTELKTGKTKPPARYTDKTLGNIMENVARLVEDDEMKLVLKKKKGIGTPATRGQIVEKLVNLKMIERKKGKFYATDYGISIIESLRGFDIIQPEMTATWESKLTDVEEGVMTYENFYEDMIAYIRSETEKLVKLKTNIEKREEGEPVVKTIGECPICKGRVINGKNYYVCENYKKSCTFVLAKSLFNAKIPVSEAKKLINGEYTKEFVMSKGDKKWRTSLYFDPDERQVVFAKKPVKPIGTCPRCGGEVRETENYYLCENYKNPCDLIIPKKLHGARVSKTDARKLLKGESVGPKEFTWRNGKKGRANIRLDGRIVYEFLSSRKREREG